MLIGLTGPIGSGKSTVATMLAKWGAVVIDADQIGREVVANNRSVQQKLVSTFGPGVLSNSGEIDRESLAGVVFRTENSRSQLNRIVHPPLLRELGRQVKKANGRRKVVVIDAALLIEWGLNRKVDLVIVVGAPQRLRLERLTARGLRPSDAKKRMQRQPSPKVFHEAADVLLGNTGSKSDLRKAVRFLWDQLIAPNLVR